MTNYKKQGKQNLAKGRRFELKVREDLESKGWIVSRWMKNVEFAKRIGTVRRMKNADEYPTMKMISGKLIPAKQGRFRKVSTGFPDFIIFQREANPFILQDLNFPPYHVLGVESKSNGRLSKEEKEKCKWLLENNIFSKMIIASKGKKRGEIIYKEVK